MNIRALSERMQESEALEKYAHAGRLLSGVHAATREEAWQQLIQILAQWTEQLGLPRLGVYDVREADLDAIVANCRGSSMKTNPVVLSDEEIRAVLRQRL